MYKPFLKTGYSGIILILFSSALIIVNPVKAGKLLPGFFNPVVAFEFVKTESEVYDIFGHDAPGTKSELVSRMETGTYVDFFYMISYTVFLLLFAGVCRRITDTNWYIFSLFIALCVLRADFGENIQLLEIMIKLPAGDFGYELGQLNIYTWGKWGGLSAYFLSLIPFLRKSGSFGRIISVTTLLSAVTGSSAFLYRSFLNEIYVLSIALIFVMLIIFSFTFKIKVEHHK